jgi:hypothetical protein
MSVQSASGSSSRSQFLGLRSPELVRSQVLTIFLAIGAICLVWVTILLLMTNTFPLVRLK